MGALVIGFSAGVVCFFATAFIKRKLKIDDSLDVFPVHGVGGILGTIFAGIFVSARLGGVGFAEDVTMGSQVGVQLIGVLATMIFTAVATYVILKLVDKVIGLRVSDEQETEGPYVFQMNKKPKGWTSISMMNGVISYKLYLLSIKKPAYAYRDVGKVDICSCKIYIYHIRVAWA